MDGRDDASFDPDEPVGSVLARMRKAQGLSGGALGQRVGMSQAKVSRIENGKGPADPVDIGRLARALDASEELVTQLMDRADTLHNRMTDWRPSPIGLAGTQRSVGDFEATTRTLRGFEPTVIQGLLQTSEYARSLLTVMQFDDRLTSRDPDEAASSIAAAVSARVRRQEILADRGKAFRFVMMESVLSNQISSPEGMLGQLRRLRDIRTQFENVSIRIVPEQTRSAIPPLHGFELFDDQLVIVDLFNTGLTSRGRSDARLYQQVFDFFEAESVSEIDPLLDKYQERYARLLLAGGP